MFKHSKDFGKLHRLIYCTRRGKIISNCQKKIFPFIFKAFKDIIEV